MKNINDYITEKANFIVKKHVSKDKVMENTIFKMKLSFDELCKFASIKDSLTNIAGAYDSASPKIRFYRGVSNLLNTQYTSSMTFELNDGNYIHVKTVWRTAEESHVSFLMNENNEFPSSHWDDKQTEIYYTQDNHDTALTKVEMLLRAIYKFKNEIKATKKLF